MRFVRIETVKNAIDEETSKVLSREWLYASNPVERTAEYINHVVEEADYFDTFQLDILIKQYEALAIDLPAMRPMYEAQIKTVNSIKRMMGERV